MKSNLVCNLGLVLFCALSSSAHAAPSRSIESFTVVRTGGGEMSTQVALINGQYVGVTKSCGFRVLTAAEQAKTRFVLSGETAQSAAAILSDRAVLASRVIMQPPLETGSWQKLEVDYQFEDFGGKIHAAKATVSDPVVLIDNVASQVLSEIESYGRGAAAAVCR